MSALSPFPGRSSWILRAQQAERRNFWQTKQGKENNFADWCFELKNNLFHKESNEADWCFKLKNNLFCSKLSRLVIWRLVFWNKDHSICHCLKTGNRSFNLSLFKNGKQHSRWKLRLNAGTTVYCLKTGNIIADENCVSMQRPQNGETHEHLLLGVPIPKTRHAERAPTALETQVGTFEMKYFETRKNRNEIFWNTQKSKWNIYFIFEIRKNRNRNISFGNTHTQKSKWNIWKYEIEMFIEMKYFVHWIYSRFIKQFIKK